MSGVPQSLFGWPIVRMCLRAPWPGHCSPRPIDHADPDADSVTEILERIPGLPERLAQAEAEVKAGEFTELGDL